MSEQRPWTPGPWTKMYEGAIKLIYGPNGERVCRMYDNPQSDGPLVESSPDLYEALVKCETELKYLSSDALGIGGQGETHWSIRDELLAEVQAALNAANPGRVKA